VSAQRLRPALFPEASVVLAHIDWRRCLSSSAVRAVVQGAADLDE
jgi:hypothetical protein